MNMMEFETATILIQYKNIGDGKIDTRYQAILQNGEEKTAMTPDQYIAFLENTYKATLINLDQLKSLSVPNLPEEVEKESSESSAEVINVTTH
jgi:hypothetical protein